MVQKQRDRSPILLKYEKALKDNPGSRVFAPLAEAYRKIGMVEESLKILRDGIKLHPTYMMGYLGLAACYTDKSQYEAAYSTLRPFVSENLENIRLQKLFAEICKNLGHFDEALETYKYLMFLNPRDEAVSTEVAVLERDISGEYEMIGDPEQVSLPAESDDDDWVQVDFKSTEKSEQEISSASESDWEIGSGPITPEFDDIVHTSAHLEQIEEEQTEKETDFEFQELDSIPEESFGEQAAEMGSSSKDRGLLIEEEGPPVVTHTLVDLYCNQRHFDKAIEVLEKILELNPGDERSITKLEEVRRLQGDMKAPAAKEGHLELMEAYDKRVNPKKLVATEIRAKFDSFLDKLRARALEFR